MILQVRRPRSRDPLLQGKAVQITRVAWNMKCENLAFAVRRKLEALGKTLGHHTAGFEENASASQSTYAVVPQTSAASWTIILSFAHCSSSVSLLPSSVEANPHCGERQSWSRLT